MPVRPFKSPAHEQQGLLLFNQLQLLLLLLLLLLDEHESYALLECILLGPFHILFQFQKPHFVRRRRNDFIWIAFDTVPVEQKAELFIFLARRVGPLRSTQVSRRYPRYLYLFGDYFDCCRLWVRNRSHICKWALCVQIRIVAWCFELLFLNIHRIYILIDF